MGFFCLGAELLAIRIGVRGQTVYLEKLEESRVRESWSGSSDQICSKVRDRRVLKIVCEEKGERKNGCDGSDYEPEEYQKV